MNREANHSKDGPASSTPTRASPRQRSRRHNASNNDNLHRATRTGASISARNTSAPSTSTSTSTTAVNGSTHTRPDFIFLPPMVNLSGTSPVVPIPVPSVPVPVLIGSLPGQYELSDVRSTENMHTDPATAFDRARTAAVPAAATATAVHPTSGSGSGSGSGSNISSPQRQHVASGPMPRPNFNNHIERRNSGGLGVGVGHNDYSNVRTEAIANAVDALRNSAAMRSGNFTNGGVFNVNGNNGPLPQFATSAGIGIDASRNRNSASAAAAQFTNTLNNDSMSRLNMDQTAVINAAASRAYAAAQQHAFQFANSLWDLDLHNHHDPESDDDDSVDVVGSVNGMNGYFRMLEGRNAAAAAAVRRSVATATVTATSVGSTVTSSWPSIRNNNHDSESPCARTSSAARRTPGTRRSARLHSIDGGDLKPSADATATGAVPTSPSTGATSSAPVPAPSAQRGRVTRSMRAKASAESGTRKVSAPSPASRKRGRSFSPDRKKSASAIDEEEEDKTTVDESKKCCICLDQPTEKELSKLDGCDHPYCFTCIEKWGERENTCPQCKARFTKIERVHKVKRRRGNGTSPAKENVNVKKVKNRDQRADYRQQNPFHGFFAHMEAHGLNILFSSGGPGNLFAEPGEQVFVSNINRAGGSAPASAGGPTASSIAASIGLFSPNMSRHFSMGVGGIPTWATNTRPLSSTASRSHPSTRNAQPPRRVVRAARMTVTANTWGTPGGSPESASAPDNHRSFLQSVANLSRERSNLDTYEHLVRLRHGRTDPMPGLIPSPRDAAAAAAASLAESVFDRGVAVGRSSRDRSASIGTMAVMAGLAPPRSFAVNGNERNAGSAENALEIMDSDEEP